MRIRLPSQALDQRIATLEEDLENDGSVTRSIAEREPPNGPWYIDLQVEAPGYRLPQTAAYRYQEWWDPSRGEWELVAYVYDYRFGPNLTGTFGYHWHELLSIEPSGAPVYHVKCLDPFHAGRDPHFRGLRMEIWEPRDELTKLDAQGQWPTCEALRPLP